MKKKILGIVFIFILAFSVLAFSGCANAFENSSKLQNLIKEIAATDIGKYYKYIT